MYFYFGQILGLFAIFVPFGVIFGVGVRFKNFFLDLLKWTNYFYFGSIALSCFFETFPGGGGWLGVVGKSDFNENPVVSLDLDLDFGLRLRVCQKKIKK